MALPNYLAKIKSAGIYRFVWDKSEIPGVDTQTLRLVVGYSPKGVFNTPVYVENQDQFKTIFGDINKKLERYGIFFHRNALECLKRSPIFCLNLKPFNNDEREKVNYFSFDNSTIFNSAYNQTTSTTWIKNLFNTDRFWTLEPEKLDSIGNKKYITIASTDEISTSKTVVIRGTRPNGYDVTFKEYFEQTLNGAEIPAYLENHENDLMSDYFAEIYVFSGEWTSQFKSSQNMIKYFDNTDPDLPMKATVTNAFGQQVDTLSVMADDPNTGFVNKYVGILLPDFQSPVSTALSLDDVFNADNATHKMMMHLNANDLFEGNVTIADVVTTGWTNCLSNSTLLSLTGVSVLSASNIDVPFNGYSIAVNGDMQNNDFNGTTTTATEVDNTKCFTIMDVNHTSGSNEIEKVLYTITGWSDNDTCKTSFSIESDTFNKLVETQIITKVDGTWTPSTALEEDVNPKSVLDSYYKLRVNDRFLAFGKDNANDTTNATERISSLSDIKVTTVSDDIAGTITITYTYIFDRGIVENAGTLADLIDYGNGTALLVKCNKGISDENQSYTELYFEGYTYSSVNFTASQKDNTINSILDVLQSEIGIRTGLTDNTSIEYHYLIDTFSTFADAISGGFKNKLALIAREKDNALALLNWPSIDSLMKNIGAGKTSTETIAVVTGNESYKCDSNYQSWVEYVTPLKYRNPYTGNKFEVPGAADLSNNYIEKFDTRYPYSIVAGPNYGVIANDNLVGPDFLYSRVELDLYEPYGVNCFVYKPRKGTFINSQQTAKQKPVTTLSKVNVRELVTYLQDEIEKLLTDYQWEFNTQSLRELVKAKADVICEQVKNNGGIYDYYNLCSEENNTEDVINNEMFVLSTSIEPGMGAGKMVQELTIYRKGGMSSVIR